MSLLFTYEPHARDVGIGSVLSGNALEKVTPQISQMSLLLEEGGELSGERQKWAPKYKGLGG